MSSITPRSRSSRRHCWWITCLCLAYLAPSFASAQDERVSLDNGRNHIAPSVARLANGNTVYVWTEAAGNGDEGLIFARRYDTDGVAIDPVPFQVNVEVGIHETATVRADGSGGFVAVWHRSDINNPPVEGIRGRIFGADGNPVGDDFIIDTQVNSTQTRPSLAVRADGSFVVVWQATVLDGDQLGIAARLFDAMGNSLGPEFIANQVTEGRQDAPEVAVDAVGNFVVVWGAQEVTARVFNSLGQPLTDDIAILPTQSSFRNRLGLAMAPGGNFMVAYDLGGAAIAGKILDLTGSDLTGEIMVSTHVGAGKQSPVIAADSGGNFQVAWTSEGQDGGGDGIFTQKVAANGTLIGVETQVNRITGANQRNPDVTLAVDGTPTFAWQGPGTSTGNGNIFTNCESLGPCAVFSDGFEKGDTTAWDSASP